MMPDHAQLVARAASLVPTPLARAAEAEQFRRLPDANVAELRAAGLFKVLQPRRCGGFEMSLPHAHRHRCRNRPRLRLDGVVHGGDPCIAGSSARFRRRPGRNAMAPTRMRSFALSSRRAARRERWRAATGSTGFCRSRRAVQHADWLLLGTEIADKGGTVVDAAELLVPARDIVIRDDWNVVGLRGTGSCSIVANDVFVPKHRYLSLPGIIAGEAPGVAAHETSLYKGAAVPVLALAITPAALGMREAAPAVFKERLPGREIAYTEHEIQIDSPTTHRQVADAATRIHVARLLLHRCADDIEAAAAHGEMMEFTPAPASAWTAPMRYASAWRRSRSFISPVAARALPRPTRSSAPGVTSMPSTCMGL